MYLGKCKMFLQSLPLLNVWSCISVDNRFCSHSNKAHSQHIHHTVQILDLRNFSLEIHVMEVIFK